MPNTLPPKKDVVITNMTFAGGAIIAAVTFVQTRKEIDHKWMFVAGISVMLLAIISVLLQRVSMIFSSGFWWDLMHYTDNDGPSGVEIARLQDDSRLYGTVTGVLTLLGTLLCIAGSFFLAIFLMYNLQ